MFNTRPWCTWYVLEVANIAGRDKPESGDESGGKQRWILCCCSGSQFSAETKMNNILEPCSIMYNVQKRLTAKSDLLPLKALHCFEITHSWTRLSRVQRQSVHTKF